MNKEIFKDIDGYEDYYQISNYGRVKSKVRVITYTNKNGKKVSYVMPEKILSTRVNNMGYVQVDLMVDKVKTTNLLHRIVGTAFIPNPNNYDQIDHKDGNKQNNHVSNLEWVTQSENVKRSHENNNRISEEAKKRLSKNVKNVSPNDRKKKVIQMDLDGNEIKEFESLIAASKEIGIDRCTIRDAITGRRGAKTAKGFKWKFKDE